ncbi:MAG: hypothetical protein EOP00_18430 [Pedobacter sp.]|nr:MAG: hypothetical protein EOP00_18430 [Pedobacter sp.]
MFNRGANLGLVKDYKILVGTSTSNSVNSVRVNNSILINRPLNYKNSSLVDVGATTVRFAKRLAVFNRSVYGSIRPR